MENIKIGNRVEISLNSRYAGSAKKGGDKPKIYTSVVEDVYDNDKVLIYMPISYGTLVKLSDDAEYNFLFITEKGMFRYSGNVVKYISKEKFNFILIKLFGEPKKIQRREFFRFECILPFRFEPLSSTETAERFSMDKDIILSKGIVKDIGGGGIRFISNEVLKESTKIKCLLPITEEPIITLGRIIQKQAYPKSNYKYQYRVEFIYISEKDKESIIKFIFDEQRKVARRSREVVKS